MVGGADFGSSRNGSTFLLGALEKPMKSKCAHQRRQQAGLDFVRMLLGVTR